MSAALAVQAGLTLWSFRKPLLVAAGLVMALPLLLVALVAAVFAPLPGPGHLLSDPLPGAPVTQPYGCSTVDREPWLATCATHHFHSGVDLGAPLGSPVHAATSGMAMVGDDPSGYGIFVIVRRDAELKTLYGHLSLVLVRSGESVAAGEVIAEIGTTGNSTGPHLHFEVRVAGQPVDPLAMLPTRTGAGGDARRLTGS